MEEENEIPIHAPAPGSEGLPTEEPEVSQQPTAKKTEDIVSRTWQLRESREWVERQPGDEVKLIKKYGEET
ncbi:hypothetical protein N0V88_006801 [Collariella sp. IMI 366227]|nr:hypothetical protein N0V88_006801 [Collariella sp. IMI 366227]